MPLSRDDLGKGLTERGYLAAEALQTALFLAVRMGRPLLLEGEPGTGKTSLAEALSQVLGAELIRLQCYEGIELSQAAYEWNVARQLLEIRLAESTSTQVTPKDLYRRDMLLERPLLRALTQERPVVLLIDEIDRADEAFEAFLLEMLAERQITVPELGTIRAEYPPIVVLTSNRTRVVHDALRRRCLYHWLEFPDAQRELAILRNKLPSIEENLAVRVVECVQAVRSMDLIKPPGVAEVLDWAQALACLDDRPLNHDSLLQSLGALLKHQDDIRQVSHSQPLRHIITGP